MPGFSVGFAIQWMPQKTIRCDRPTQIILCKIIGGLEEIRQITGSRNPNGNVPNVNWNPNYGKVNVNWWNPDNRNGNIRPREEVSINKPFDKLRVRKIKWPGVISLRNALPT